MPEWQFWLLVTVVLVVLAVVGVALGAFVQGYRRERFIRQVMDLGQTRQEAENAADWRGL